MRNINAIEIRELSTGYRNKNETVTVAKNLSAEIAGGLLICLLGANGAGKSTLLRTIAGFQPKLSGEILLYGKPLESCSKKKLSQTVGVVLTEKPAVRNMTVRELVGLGRNPYTGFWGKLSHNDENLIDEAISSLKIESLAGRFLHTLSDGERQKAMIAKVLAQATPVILLDEPTAFLDFPSRVEIMRMLLFLAREKNKTVFLSTHDLELALQTADQLWLLGKDSLKTGSPNELKNDGSIENFFSCEGVVFDRENGVFRIIQY
jgi:iron complex transport system ATP-binding protein